MPVARAQVAVGDLARSAIFYDAALGDSRVGGTTVEHEMVGIQSLLGGQSIARYMIWDGMRSIDVLQSLPFVDATRIGVSGCWTSQRSSMA